QADALLALDQWADALKATETYELKRAAVDLDLEIAQATGSRGRGLAIGLAIAALAILGIGLYAANLAQKANRAIEQTAQSASRVIDEEDDRKTREAFEYYNAQIADGGAEAGARSKPKKKKP
ncbi:MAG TPA: hypothetical protein PKA88_38315, partial [Polyangiaceae bacterium]|nr:hypothetical protein [Polyangiaceae bacterium]